MKKLALVLLTLAVTVGTAHAVDVNGKKGIGVSGAIGGPAAFAFNFGTGNMNIEALLGINFDSPKDNDGAGYALKLGAGLHYHALRAEKAAWTVGGRINIGFQQGVTPKGGDAPDATTQFGLDIPMRVYWFPNKNLSLHWETGISIALVPEDKGSGTPFASRGGEGTYMSILSPMTGIGATFWW